MTACDDEIGWRKTTHQPTNKGISKSRQWWAAMTAMLRHDGNTMATMMDGNGQCNGNATASTGMECGGHDGGAPTSGGRQRRQRNGDCDGQRWTVYWQRDSDNGNGCHRGMLARYGRAFVHFELSSVGYKYGAPPTARGTASPMPAPSRPWTW